MVTKLAADQGEIMMFIFLYKRTFMDLIATKEDRQFEAIGLEL